MWIPHLPTDGTPIFRQLFAALERAIADGVLPMGTRLPPQRALAGRLGVSVGTVTRAYEEADRRGLTVGHVGRGTYVAGPKDQDMRRAAELIDLSMNVPPMAAAERLLAEIWGKVRRRPEFLEVFDYAPVEGVSQARRMACAWLAKTARLPGIDPARLVITAGCQSSMDLVMSQLCQPGDAVLVEELTFSGIKAIAQHRGYRLVGVAMDRDGLLPDAVSRAARASNARVLYTMPTLHNPTARTMPSARRRDLLKAVRKAGIVVVEDDNYAVYADSGAPEPLAALAPDLCFYVSGLSKSIAPGLRTGFVAAPDAASAQALAQRARAAHYAVQTMGLLLAREAIEDGAAEQIIKENRRILEVRTAALRRLLASAQRPVTASAHGIYSPHTWLTVPEGDCERLESRLLRDGVRITPVSAPRVEGAQEWGVRLCTGAPRRDEDFKKAIELLHRALVEPIGMHEVIV